MKDIFDKTDHFKERENILSHLLYGNPNDCPNPLVSVIMPVYNRPDTFPASLASVLNQQCDFPFEVVVVDNKADVDRTESQDIVEATGAKNIMYYRNAENIGMYDNWNRGIWLSRGKYYTYCHDDDILLPGALQRLIDLQKQIGEKKCIFSKYNMIDAEDNYIRKYEYPHKKGLLKEQDYYNYTLFDHFVGPIAVGVGCLFNRECALEIGGYDREYYPCSDIAFQARYTYYYGSVVNNIPTFNYRVSINDSRNIDVILKIQEMTCVVRKCIQRKLHFPDLILNLHTNAMYRLTPWIMTDKFLVSDKTRLKPYRSYDPSVKKFFMSLSRNKGFSLFK
ncbi:MAG: glycosyltransferase [Paludibacteraceae bacterium]|nr:glycosyltransferase [Paludibacteraceae bacterium]